MTKTGKGEFYYYLSCKELSKYFNQKRWYPGKKSKILEKFLFVTPQRLSQNHTSETSGIFASNAQVHPNYRGE